MKRILAILVALPVLQIACAKPEEATKQTSPSPLTVKRVVTNLTSSPPLPVNPLTTDGCPTKTFTTGNTTSKLKISFDWNSKKYKYKAIVGPNSVIALLEDGSLYVCEGWAYVWHKMRPFTAIDMFPWVQTEHAIAGADGSVMLVERRSNANRETIIYGYGGKVRAQAVLDENKKEKLDKNKDNYLHTKSNNDKPELDSLDTASSPTEREIRKMRRKAAENGGAPQPPEL
jgi:hypothetical protein